MKVKSLLTLLIILTFFHNSLAQNKNDKRIFRHTLKPVNKINLAKHQLYKSNLFTVNEKGDIALFNYGKFALVYFDHNNYKKANYLSKGVGGGPKEFKNPTDLNFGPQNKIWLADPDQARISVWHTNGKLDDTFNHDKLLPSKIAVNKKRYLIMSQKYSSALGVFHLYDQDDKKVESFGKLRKELVSSSFGYEGSIAAGISALYYAGTNSGFLKKYSLKGKEMFSVKTINPVPTVVAERKTLDDVNGYNNVRVTKRPDDAKTTTLDIAVKGNKIYDLFSGNSRGYGEFIDVYDKKDGKYIESFKLSDDYGEVYGFDVSAKHFFLLCYNRGSAKYSILKLSEKANK